MSYTDKIVELACLPVESIPRRALEAGRYLVQDTLACTIAGYDAPSSHTVVDALQRFGGEPTATVLSTGAKIASPTASYINAHMGNAVDADDTIHYKAHVASGVVAPALAIAEQEGRTGLEFLAAVVLGYDVASRIAMSLKVFDEDSSGRLQFAPITGYTAVSFGAAVATGRLLGLDQERMRHAIALTAASAPLPASSQFGSNVPRPMSKYALYGALAQAGVTAAHLAQAGFTGEPQPLDGDRGFWRVVGSTACNWDILDDRLGERFLVEEVIYKVYPGCRFLSQPIDMFLDFSAEHGLSPDDIDSIEVRVGGNALAKGMDSSDIDNLVDACFSMPYLLAAAAYAGAPSARWHDPAPDVKEKMDLFMKKVTVKLEDSALAAQVEDLRTLGHSARMPASIDIRVGDRSYRGTRQYAKGDPYDEATRFTVDDHRHKLENYGAGILPEEKIAGLLTALDGLTDARDVSALIENLVRSV